MKKAANSNSKSTVTETAPDTLKRGRRAENRSLTRECQIVRSDDKDMTVQVLFSSETPVERVARQCQEDLGIAKKGEKYWEVLDHNSDENADFSELNRNAPVFDEHDPEKQVGNVKRAKRSKDKVGRALLTFDGDSGLSRTRYKQTAKGNRAISFGYDHTKLVREEELADGRTVKRIAFKASEISSVGNPADHRAGANRGGTAIEDGEAVCLGCGDAFDADELDENQECAECAEDGERGSGDTLKGGHQTRSAAVHGFRLRRGAMTRGTFTFNNLLSWVRDAAIDDPRFNLRPSGDLCSWIYVADIQCDEKGVINGEDVDVYSAIIQGSDGKYYEVEFTFDDDGDVELGKETEVKSVLDWEPVKGRDEKDASDLSDGDDERFALMPDGRLFRGDSGKKPYGDVEYADPGYQSDKKKRYPIDTKAHAKAAWDYINKSENADKYTSEDLAKVKAKIKAACKKFGVKISDGRSAASGEHRTLNEDTLKGGHQTQVDSQKKVTEERHFISMKTVAELKTQAPELVTQIETETRAAAAKDTTKNIRALNEEITKRCDKFVEDHGKKQRGGMADTLRKVANEFITRDHGAAGDGQVLAEFGQRCLEEIAKVKPEPYLLRARVSDKEYRSYSFGRALRSAVKDAEKRGQGGGQPMPTDFEGEVHLDMIKRAKDEFGGLGFSPGGFLVPHDAPTVPMHAQMRRGRIQMAPMTRDLYAGDFGSGGALVPTEFSPTIIEPLYNRLALSALGITHLPGLQGNIVIPRMTGVSQPQAVGEIAQLAASQPTFDQVEGRPRRAGNTVPYSKQLVMQGSPPVEALIRDDNFRMIALFIDEMGLNGTGGNAQPLGLMNQPGISSVVFGGQASLQTIIAMETAIRKANINDPVSYLSTSNTRGVMRGEPAALRGSTIVSGQTNALWTGKQDDEEMNGRPAFDSQQVPNDQVICAAGEHFVHLMWGGLDVVVDYYTRAAYGEIVLTINTWNDFILRHAQAVCVSADAGSQ